MPTLRHQGFMIRRALNNQFDHLAAEKKRLEAALRGVSLPQCRIDLNGGRQLAAWPTRPPNAGFDIVRVGKPGIVENQLGQLIYREPLHRRGSSSTWLGSAS